MGHGCEKCRGFTAGALVVVGLLFLLVDLAVWDFWGIQWWTAIFLVFGLLGLSKSKCPDCKKMCK